MKHIAIIGAGLAGLTAAGRLKEHAAITLFEKSRGVGGRMSTRRAPPYAFDHGAQFFKARSTPFKTFLEPMLKCGLVKPWNARFAELSPGHLQIRQIAHTEGPHYVAVPGMNALAKFLSRELTVQLGTEVGSITKTNGLWSLKDLQGNHLGNFDWVISALPFPQASKVMPQSLTGFSALNAVKMKGCFALMLGFEKALPLEFDAARVSNADISWVSVNNSKPERSKAFSLLVHSTNTWADDHLDDDPAWVTDHLGEQTSDLIGHDISKAGHKVIHRWRYANSDERHGNTHLLDREERVGVCGDWFIQGKVEAAFTSGFDMADSLLRELKNG